MYFKRIDMHGFKSFAEPVSIEFHEGITCVVGPNGSGKSNISDAIRWVLGEQSPKTLRGGKMEEVIFAGTASRKSRGMAEVTLVIDNTKGILPIDYSEVAITRRMYRSGESEYSINNNPCRLRDIRSLIMDTGIGVDGYSLIGQGKIADIISNKPESRREIFEEAAGIVQYRSKKAEAERKLESATGNLDRVNDIVGELGGRIDGLREDSEKAREYLSLRERYKKLEINITLKQIEAIELKNEYLIDDIAEADAAIEGLREQKEAIDERVAEGRVRSGALDELSAKTTERLIAAIDALNRADNQSQLSKERLAVLERNEIRLGEESKALEEKIAREEGNLEALRRGNKEIEARLAEKQGELEAKVGAHAKLSQALSVSTEVIDAEKNKIFSAHRSISQKESEIKSLKSLQDTLERRKQQVLGEQLTEAGENTRLAEKLKELQEEKTALDATLTEIKKEQVAGKEQLTAFETEEKSLSLSLEELKLSIGQLSSRKKTIEEMESNYEGYNQGVKFIMGAGLKGIDGVVAELIEVPKGFETAIETALGGSLQNIVCADEESAKAGINALKSAKAGRLTFLPRTMVVGKPSGGVDIKNAKGFKGFGVDCVSFDGVYKGVMEYLLGRVIVLDTLDNAIALSRRITGGFRFVTLEGEIISAGGAITGGAYRNKTANLLERRSEIATLEATLKEKNEKSLSLGEELTALRDSMRQSKSKLQALEERQRELSLECLTKENQIALGKDSLTDFENSREKQGRELKGIDTEQADAEKMAEALKAEIEKLFDTIKKTENLVEEVLKEHQTKKEALSQAGEEITAARIQVGKWESEKESGEAMDLRISQGLGDLKAQIAEKLDEKEKLVRERQLLLSGTEVSPEELAKMEEDKVGIERYLEEINKEKAEVNSELTKAGEEKDTFDREILGYQDQKYQSEIKKAKNETQLDTYKEKLWEEFEISYLQAIEFRKHDVVMSAAIKESREIKARMKELGDVNIGAIEEYKSVDERYSFLTEQKADIVMAMEALKQIIEDMDRTIKEKFKESFDKIVINFEDIFKELFGGGNAELRIEDPDNPLETGIEIIAQPPGKKLQNINLLSGGEKTMTAIALMFAVLKTKPTPFCILDEVEAALDDANIERFAAYLKTFKEIQFTLVTHQKATMEHADVLYGVTMPEQGISKILSLRLGDEVPGLQ